MNPQTMRAIAAILEADQTVSGAEKTSILKVCQEPENGRKPPINGQHRRFVNPKQAAEIMSTSLRTVWRLAREGRIRRVKLGIRSTRFPLEDIENIDSLDGDIAVKHV